MTDLHPAWATIHDLRRDLDDALAGKAQAERAQADAEAAQADAEQRVQAEADRADGNEAHVRRLLAEFAIDPTLPGHIVDRIADLLHDDLNGGLATDRVAEVARAHINAYQEEVR